MGLNPSMKQIFDFCSEDGSEVVEEQPFFWLDHEDDYSPPADTGSPDLSERI